MRYFMIVAILLAAALAPAQNLVIEKVDGTTLSVKVLDIASLSFSAIPTPPDTVAKPDTIQYGRMVWIPGGAFEMGSNQGAVDETPVHVVTLNGFYMDVYEVTNAQYRQFCDATGHSYPTSPTDGYIFGMPSYPVVNVSYQNALDYATWAGKSLPTEAEWEYAARGGLHGKRYPWGDELPLYQCNWRGYSAAIMANISNGRGTMPVGSFDPNGYGLYDMAGNVWERCLDWYKNTYYNSSPQQNPLGPDIGSAHVLRGGSWRDNGDSAADVRVADRYTDEVWYLYNDYGFRCVIRP